MNIDLIADDDHILGDASTSTSFIDVSFGFVGAFIVILMLALSMIAVAKQNASDGIKPQEDIIFEMEWSSDIDADIDSWGQSPKGQPIGYSNKTGQVYSLDRDDLGNRSEYDTINYERITGRGRPDGMHCFNAHLFSNQSGIFPITVTGKMTLVDNTDGSAKVPTEPTIVEEIRLEQEGQEVNFFCFILENGELDESEYGVFRSDSICLRSPMGCS